MRFPSPFRELRCVLALGALFACGEPAQEPVEFAPGSRTAPDNAETRATSQDRSQGTPAEGESPSQAYRRPAEGQGLAAPSPSNPGSSSTPGGLAGLEGLKPGAYTELTLTPSTRVYGSLSAPFATMDRQVGQQIFSMYQALKAESWTKDGPALVVVQGDRSAPLVNVEVSFRLLSEATNVDKHLLKADTLPGGKAIATMHQGPRARLQETDSAIDEWMKAEGKRPTDDQRWYVFMNRPDQVPEAELMTAIIQPIE